MVPGDGRCWRGREMAVGEQTQVLGTAWLRTSRRISAMAFDAFHRECQAQLVPHREVLHVRVVAVIAASIVDIQYCWVSRLEVRSVCVEVEEELTLCR